MILRHFLPEGNMTKLLSAAALLYIGYYFGKNGGLTQANAQALEAQAQGVLTQAGGLLK
jgi:hypothetical protein